MRARCSAGSNAVILAALFPPARDVPDDMTIIASVKVHDGIVLGADSMTQLIGQDAEGKAGFVQSYQHAQKLHQIGSFPIGVMAFGIGNIGPRSIGSFVSE